MLNPQAVLVRAHGAYQARRFDEAIATLTRLAGAGARQPQVLHLLALSHKGRGDVGAARRAFEDALAVAPRDHEALNNYANLLSDVGEHEAALARYEAALAAKPDFGDARLNRALLLTRLGRFDQALAELDQLARDKPDGVAVHLARGNALRGLDRLPEAEEAFGRALMLDPSRASALHGAARVALEQGKPASALYRRAIAHAPGDPELALGLAEALEAEGDPEALPTLERVVASRPDWVEGQTALARMRWEAGEGRAFTRGLEAAVVTHGGDPLLWRALAGALAAADLHGDSADAAQRGQEALRGDAVLALIEAVQASEAGDLARADRLFSTPSAPVGGRDVLEARHRLRFGDVNGAEALVERALDAEPWDVSAWALRGLIWRLRDDARAEWLHGQPGLVAAHGLDLDRSALDAIAARLRALHRTRAHPIGQSLRGGTQTRGRLFSRREPEIRLLREAITAVLDRHWNALPPRDDAHPLLRHRDARPRLDGSWSVRLTGGGFHVAHVHTQGVLSSACYLAVPPGGEDGEGWIEIGRPPPELGLALEPTASFAPEPGRLVLFPSTLFHGTRPFGTGERLTAAFDVVPTEER